MNFSAKVKNELASIEIDDRNEALSELVGMVRTNGTISINFKGDIRIRFETMAGYIARRIFKLVKFLYNYDAKVSVINDGQLRKKNLYQVSIEDEISRFILEDAGYKLNWQIASEKDIDEDFLSSIDEKAYLRGAFLGAGSVSDPTSSYHLEIISFSERTKDLDILMAERAGIKFNVSMRNEDYILYLKSGDSISSILNVMGAQSAMLDFENVRVLKDVRNSVNRLVNAETSNINKTVEAAIKQVRAIEKIDKEIGLDSLDYKLQEIALVRLEYPSDSLKDLGQRLASPLGKSGVSHRLKKIIDIADSL